MRFNMDKNLSTYIMQFKEVISPDDCKKIVDHLKINLWKKHYFTNPKTGENKTFDDDLEYSFNDSWTTSFIMDKVDSCIQSYQNYYKFQWFSGIQGRTLVRYNKYEVGTCMHRHMDNITTIFDGERKGTPMLSVLGLLNDDFEGGEFVILEDQVIPFKTGDIIIFPSNFLYPHEVLHVTKGTRYSFISWTW